LDGDVNQHFENHLGSMVMGTEMIFEMLLHLLSNNMMQVLACKGFIHYCKFVLGQVTDDFCVGIIDPLVFVSEFTF
jgi:hypothetical protein